jgi:hypothetical protein
VKFKMGRDTNFPMMGNEICTVDILIFLFSGQDLRRVTCKKS